MKAEKLPVALIGAGRWGKIFLKNLQHAEQFKLTWVATKTTVPLEISNSGIQHTQDWQKVVADPDVAAVIIATPPALHYEMACAVLLAGKAMIIEKPLTLDLQQAESLYQIATTQQAQVLVDHIHLYNPAFRYFMQACPALAEIQSIETVAGNWGPFRADTSVLWDWFPHDLAMLMKFSRAPLKLESAEVLEANHEQEGDGKTIAIKLTINDPSNPARSIPSEHRISNLFPHKIRQMSVKARQEIWVFDDMQEEMVFHLDQLGQRKVLLTRPLHTPIQVLLEEFALMIRAGKSYLDDLELALGVVKLINQVEQIIGR